MGKLVILAALTLLSVVPQKTITYWRGYSSVLVAEVVSQHQESRANSAPGPQVPEPKEPEIGVEAPQKPTETQETEQPQACPNGNCTVAPPVLFPRLLRWSR